MQARIKSSSRFPTLTFFSGYEFTKNEWRDVPNGCESQALENEWLEIRDGEPANNGMVEIAAPAGIEPVLTAPIVEVIEPEIAEEAAEVIEPPKVVEPIGKPSRRGGR